MLGKTVLALKSCVLRPVLLRCSCEEGAAAHNIDNALAAACPGLDRKFLSNRISPIQNTDRFGRAGVHWVWGLIMSQIELLGSCQDDKSA